MMGGAAAAVLLVVVAIAAYSFWPESGPEIGTSAETSKVADESKTTAVVPGSGELILSVSPWANVESIRHKEDGGTVEIASNLVTPCTIPLEGGDYLVQVSNPNFGSMDIEVSIQAGEASRIHRVLPRFDLDQELSRLESSRQ